MITFTVHTGDPKIRMKAKLEDLGLQYVSKFTMEDGSIVTSIAPRGCTTDERLALDAAELEGYGYFDIVTESIS